MKSALIRLPSSVGSALWRRLPAPVKAFAARHKLALAISGAILVALVQTVISVGMYVNSSTYGLDLSRPDFERAKREVEPLTAQSTFSPSGPINPRVIDEFNKLYTEQSRPLNTSGRYDGTPLGDAELRFGHDGPSAE